MRKKTYSKLIKCASPICKTKIEFMCWIDSSNHKLYSIPKDDSNTFLIEGGKVPFKSAKYLCVSCFHDLVKYLDKKTKNDGERAFINPENIHSFFKNLSKEVVQFT